MEKKKLARPPSAFVLFSKDVRKELYKDFGWKEISNEIAKRWKFLDNPTKSSYKQKANKLLEEYMKTKESSPKKAKKTKTKSENLKNAVFNFTEIDTFEDLSELFRPKITRDKKERQPLAAPLVPPKITRKKAPRKKKAAQPVNQEGVAN